MTREEAIETLKNSIISEERGKDGKPNGNITCDLTREVLEMAIKVLEWTRWIPVDEMLPKSGEYVLATDDVDMFVAYVTDKIKGKYEWHSFDKNYYKNTPIVAWMPLPPFYEPQESEVQDADSD